MKWKKIVNDNLIEVKYLVDYVCLSCKTDWKPNIQLTNEGKDIITKWVYIILIYYRSEDGTYFQHFP